MLRAILIVLGLIVVTLVALSVSRRRGHGAAHGAVGLFYLHTVAVACGGVLLIVVPLLALSPNVLVLGLLVVGLSELVMGFVARRRIGRLNRRIDTTPD